MSPPKLPKVTPSSKTLANGAQIAKGAKGSRDQRWWLESRGEAHDSLMSAFGAAYNSSSETGRRERWRKYLQLYGGAEAYAFSSDWYRSTFRGRSGPIDGWASPTRLSLNVIRNLVNATQARICKARPKAQFMTSDGDFLLQRKAEGMTQFTDGLFAENDAARLMPRVKRDALIGDGGVIRVLNRRGRVRFERVFPWEVVVNAAEGQYGAEHVRTWYLWKLVDREVLRARCVGKNRDPQVTGGSPQAQVIQAIDDAEAVPLTDPMVMYDTTSQAEDLVPIVAAWHLPASPDDKGRWVECIDGATLLDVDWTRPKPPLLILGWSEPTWGVWSNGIAEELLGIQLEINYLVRTMQRAHHKVGRPFIMVPRGARLAQGAWTNEVASFVEFDGPVAPQVATFAVVPAEMYAHLERLQEKAAELIGMSQGFAEATTPQGMEQASGVARRRQENAESQRLAIYSRNYELEHIDLAEMALDEVRELAESGAYKVAYRGANGIASLDWKSIALDREQYRIGVFPANALSDDPAEKIADAQDLISLGVIQDRQQILDIFQTPDLKASISLDTAPRALALKQIAEILEGSDSVTLDPNQDVETANRLALLAYQHLLTQKNVPESVAEAMREYMSACDAAVKKKNAAAAGPAGNIPPPGPGGPPPPPGAMPPPNGAPPAPPMPMMPGGQA